MTQNERELFLEKISILNEKWNKKYENINTTSNPIKLEEINRSDFLFFEEEIKIRILYDEDPSEDVKLIRYRHLEKVIPLLPKLKEALNKAVKEKNKKIENLYKILDDLISEE